MQFIRIDNWLMYSMLAAPYSNKDSTQDPDVYTSPFLAFGHLEGSLRIFGPIACNQHIQWHLTYREEAVKSNTKMEHDGQDDRRLTLLSQLPAAMNSPAVENPRHDIESEGGSETSTSLGSLVAAAAAVDVVGKNDILVRIQGAGRARVAMSGSASDGQNSHGQLLDSVPQALGQDENVQLCKSSAWA